MIVHRSKKCPPSHNSILFSFSESLVIVEKTRDPWGREEREIADQLIVATHVLIKWNVML